MSHGFWALDEYASAEVSCSDRSGYLNIPTRNTLFFSCQATVPCIMQSSSPPFTEPQPICEYTLGQVGLADVNENSVPDLYEAAPDIEFMSFPGVQMDTLLPDDQYVLSIKVWNDAVPNINSQQNADQRIDYAPAIRSGEISYNGAPFLPIAPTDGTWDEASEILAYDMVDDPLEPGLNTITMRVKNRVDLAAQVDKQVFVIGLKYYYISAASHDSTIQVLWTTAGEVFGAAFEVLRADITTGEGETSIAVVTIPDEATRLGRAYSYLDKDVKPGHQYRYRLRGSFEIDASGEHHAYEFFSKEAAETAMIPVGKLVSYLLPNPTADRTSFTVAIPKTFRDPSGSGEPALSSGAARSPAAVEVRTDVDIGIYMCWGSGSGTIYNNSRYGGVITRSWDGIDSHGRVVRRAFIFSTSRRGI